MIALAEVFVEVMPDFSKLGPKVRTELPKHIPANAGDDAGKKVGHNFGSAFLGGFGKLAGGVGVLLAGAGIANVFSSVISEAREAGQVTRLTENAIRATGGAANVTASQVGSLAQAISNKTGIDDEQVQASANLLLTFKGVRNELGEGNAVFDRATALTQDLAAAGFGSAEGASKMLGKALNDPIAGLTALGRAGVTFTDQQKEQIKTLVETGDVLGAQRIILDEVASQVGGAAEAAADPMQRLGVVVNNLKERLGTALMPVIVSVAGFLLETFIPAIERLFGWLSDRLGPVFAQIGGAVQSFFASFKAGDSDIASSGLPGFLEKVGFWARVAFDYFRDEALPRLRDFADWIVTKVVPAIRDYLSSALEGLRGYFDQIQAAVERNQPALQKLGEAFINIGKWIVENVFPAMGWLAEHVFPLLGAAVGKIVDIIAGMVSAVEMLIGWLETLATWINSTADVIRNFGTATKAVWDFIVATVGDAIGWLTSTISAWVDTTIQFFANLRDTVSAIWEAAWSWISTRASDFISEVSGKVGGFFNGIRDWFDTGRRWIEERWEALWTWVSQRATAWKDNILTIIGALPEGITSFFRQIPEMLRSPINSIIGVINRLIDLVNVPLPTGLHIDRIGTFAAGGPVGESLPGGRGGFASGGRIFGPGGPTDDKVPILASAGEWIIRASAARKLGSRFMRLINYADRNGIADIGGDPANTLVSAMRINNPLGSNVMRFAAGGSVPDVQAWIRAQDPKPYIWGGAGPGGFDCSGITGAVFGKLLGRSGAGSGARYFTTGSNFGALGFQPGTGAYTIGVTGGHMAGNLSGLGFEARSTATGIFTGSAAKSVTGFSRQYYLPQVAGQFVGGGGDGGFIDVGALARAAFDAASGAVLSAIDSIVADLGLAGQVISGVVRMGRDGISNQLATMDRGGYLMPGWNGPIWNGTGRPEPVGPAMGGGVTINVHGSVVTERDLVRAVRNGLNRLDRRGDPGLS